MFPYLKLTTNATATGTNEMLPKLSHLQITTHKEKVRAFQMLALKELRESLSRTHANDLDRLSRVFTCLLSLKKFQTNIIEELFFTKLIGNVEVARLMHFILYLCL